MKDIYQIGGVSKQGFHQWIARDLSKKEEEYQLLPVIREIRRDHPKMSCRQLYKKLKPETMGRDRFEEFCYNNGFKVVYGKNKRKTTEGKGYLHFPNLLFETDELTGVNQLWVSDITYFDIGSQTYYLTFIMDVYNREIIGYAASKTLGTEETTLVSLKMVLEKRNPPKDGSLIIHSDGGGQYYSKQFLSITRSNKIRNSMGRTAYENPYAERINGIIKNDYLIPWGPKTFEELEQFLSKAVWLYNNDRPHSSLKGYCPKDFLQAIKGQEIMKTWLINKSIRIRKKKIISITSQLIN